MARRTGARNAVHADPVASAQAVLPPADPFAEQLTTLRRQWKWAAFCQFLFTFAQLLAMDDVTLNDIEDDLVRGSSLVLPRIIIRLLFTLTYDRKIGTENWQSALRRQYYKRDPFANPIGPEPAHEDAENEEEAFSTRDPTVEPHQESEEPQMKQDEEVLADKDDTEAMTKKDVSTPEEISERDTHTRSGISERMTRARKDMLRFMDLATVEELEKQETKNWLDLPMLEKLETLHLLQEWQFQAPGRLRTLMRSDDEQATWRIEPIGYDARLNAYWLIGTDRLWIQRVPPKPPRGSKSLKRKRGTSNKTTSKSKRAAPPSKRPRLQKAEEQKPVPDKGKTKAPSEAPAGRGRAAKAQANLKLDAQAKELAELNRQAAAMARGGTRSSKRQASTSATTSRPLGTRVSKRLRGSEDDEWQRIPQEWLDGAPEGDDYKESKKRLRPAKTGLESDGSDASELTELSDEENETGDHEEEPKEEAEPAEEETDDEIPQPPSDFVEWETICSTLYEWEHIAERWEKASHYAEKALYKVLSRDLVPVITAELREIENKRKMEEAITHRKRSSRIAIRETEKEEALAAAKRKAEEEERNGRARRAEARQQKEEMERLKRENAREQRRKDREARELAEQKRKEEEEERERQMSMEVDVVHDGPSASRPAPNGTSSRKRAVSAPRPKKGGSSGTHTPMGDDWELDCEICHRKGINLDDGTPLLCCGSCGKWQHIQCHDLADARAGRRKRNWEKVDFMCQQCKLRRQYSQTQAHYNGHTTSYQRGTQVPAMNGYPPRPLNDVWPPQQHHSGYASAKPISFTHYQPQQRGFSTAASSQPSQFYMNGGATQRYPEQSHYQHQDRGTSNGAHYGEYAHQQQPQRSSGWDGSASNTNGYQLPPVYGSSDRPYQRGDPAWMPPPPAQSNGHYSHSSLHPQASSSHQHHNYHSSIYQTPSA